MTVYRSAEDYRAAIKEAGVLPAGHALFKLVAEPVMIIGAEADRTLRFCFSDGSVDRMGDTINQHGWDLRDFERNPVALWAHDSTAPPIGLASALLVERCKLMGDIQFAPPETYGFADLIYRLVKGRFLRAVSVGFMPIEYKFVENDPIRGFGINFLKQALLEISVCPVPANPNALQEARLKGIDTRPIRAWAERALDGGQDWPRFQMAEIEGLRQAAKELPTMAMKPARRTPEDKPENEPEEKITCGRAKDEPCGLDDPRKCGTHRELDDDKALMRLLRRLAGSVRREEGHDEPDGDEIPMAHHDAIRMAHKLMMTSKAFLDEAKLQHTKALGHLETVVREMNAPAGEPEDSDEKPGSDGDQSKAVQLARAEALRVKLRLA